jgi:hypothetical protein
MIIKVKKFKDQFNFTFKCFWAFLRNDYKLIHISHLFCTWKKNYLDLFINIFYIQ